MVAKAPVRLQLWYPGITIHAGAAEVSEVLLMEISPFKSAHLHLDYNLFVASYDHLRTICERFEVKYLYFSGNRLGAHSAIWCKNCHRPTLVPPISASM